MSNIDNKKPETREELIKILTEAAEKTTIPKAYLKHKPTISGTAKILNIHRDTLYTWMKEFNVDFKEVLDQIPTTASVEAVEDAGSVYLIGEALLGEGNEVAHIDLLIGDKNGPVGKAFATGLSNLSAGHTPLLALQTSHAIGAKSNNQRYGGYWKNFWASASCSGEGCRGCGGRGGYSER
jgi:hypothetical protein